MERTNPNDVEAALQAAIAENRRKDETIARLEAALGRQGGAVVAKSPKSPVFHILSTVFEGFIGACHVLSPKSIYQRNASKEIKLLSKFTGSMMLAFAWLSWRSRRDTVSPGGRAVAESLALYHAAASAVNCILGCGIDGTIDRRRDILHAVIHAFISIGCSTLLRRTREDGGEGKARRES